MIWGSWRVCIPALQVKWLPDPWRRQQVGTSKQDSRAQSPRGKLLPSSLPWRAAEGSVLKTAEEPKPGRLPRMLTIPAGYGRSISLEDPA